MQGNKCIYVKQKRRDISNSPAIQFVQICNLKPFLQMTPGEMKFALRVEGALNTIPEPEFRQMMVEALMVLSLISEFKVS